MSECSPKEVLRRPYNVTSIKVSQCTVNGEVFGLQQMRGTYMQLSEL